MALTSLKYKKSSYNLSYEIINPNAQKDILFLHGWGSNKELMKQSFAKHLSDFRQIYVDLPGFGNSTCEAILTTYDYAEIIKLFTGKLHIENYIVLGHSFGGKIATLLNPKVLVLVGSAGILVPKSFKVKSKIIFFKLFKSIGLDSLRKFFIADDAKELQSNMYETFKIVIAEDFREDFQKLTSKTLLFWGKDDSATPLYTANAIEQIISDATLYVYEGDHYFFMQNAKDISKRIEENL